MLRTRTDTKALIIPVAGVCNVRPLANELFDPMRASLQETLDATVLQPFVPPKLGVRQPITKTVADFHEYLAHVEHAFPKIPKIVLGHSMGGLLAHEAVTNSNSDQYLGSITLAAPLGGIHEDHWLVHKDRVREINALAADLTGNGAHLAQLAAQYDTIVPWESALTLIEGSSRYLQRNHCSPENRVARMALLGVGHGIVEHNALLRQPDNIRLVTFLAATMLEKVGIEQPGAFYVKQFDLEPFKLAA